MPKGLAAETCPSDAKRNYTSSVNTKKSAPLASLINVFGTKSATAEKTSSASCKKKISAFTTKSRSAKPAKSNHELKLKSSSLKKSTNICAKTRSGVGVAVSSKDTSNVPSSSEPSSIPAAPQFSKMKDKAKVPSLSSKELIKANSKDVWVSKRTITTKNLTKKIKYESSRSSTVANVRSEPVVSTNDPVLPKKDMKKRKEQLSDMPPTALALEGRDEIRKVTCKSIKRSPEVAAIVTKRELGKSGPLDEAATAKKEARVTEERCMVPKKRIKHKCVADSAEGEKLALVNEKSLVDAQTKHGLAAAQSACPEAQVSLSRNVKFFKSKNRKTDKCKDASSSLSSSAAAIGASDGAFSVYDNLDEDSEECTSKKCPKRKPMPLSKVKMKMLGSETVTKSRRALHKSKMMSKVSTVIKDSGKVPPKKQTERSEKRRLESDSDPEAGVKVKKAKRVLVNSGDRGNIREDENVTLNTAIRNAPKGPKNSNRKATTSKRLEEAAMASSSSDNAPLNQLVFGKASLSPSKVLKPLALKREVLFEESDENLKSKTSKWKKGKSIGQAKVKPCSKLVPLNDVKVRGMATAPSNETKMSKISTKKSVKFARKVRSSSVAAKPTPQRRQRMASLNALAMVHCMYENESKNVSVSSFDSTENSDDTSEHMTPSLLAISSRNVATSMTTDSSPKSNSFDSPKKSVSFHAESYIQQSLANDIKFDKSTSAVLVKFEPNLEQANDPVICRDSLRMAPGLRSVGKHWDMNGSSISSTLSDDNEISAVAAPPLTTGLPQTPIVSKEYQDTSILEKSGPLSSKKKFSRALHRPVIDDSSEEEKHRALLLEEKQRMMQRRRRQRSKEIAMDLKDMVVCKRMASLNATAILAASYSSSSTPAGRRTIAIKSATAVTSSTATGNSGNGGGKSDEKHVRKNLEESSKETKTTNKNLVCKRKNARGKLPLIRKKFSSSSDADIEDEADVSGSEVVVKTATSSGKQQVSLIVNQDSGVTITGLYLNSTTKSTHRQGFCSISGMQYHISSTSHTQTEATTVTTEAVVRTPQEPLGPSLPVSMHADRQDLSPGQQNVHSTNHSSPIKTYTPLGALSNMQPPGSPHHLHHHHHHHHPKTVAIASSTQEMSSLERHGCPSAFSSPTVYGPPPPPPSTLTTVAARPPYPLMSDTSPEPSFVAGYYQPAGPLISHHHHHHHHHHHVQTNSTVTTSATGLPTSTATSTAPSSSTISFAKISQSPLVQPPTPPASNVTQPISSELSDSEMASATTPAAEITVSESATEETGYPLSYRFASSSSSSGVAGPAATTVPPFRSPSHNYQMYYPSPPSTASLSHQHQHQHQHQLQHQHQQHSQMQQQHQQPPSHFQEILYNTNPSMAPLPSSSGGYHHGYLPVKGPPYHHPPPPPPPPPPTLQRRYIPALSPQQQYFHHDYPTPVPLSAAVSQQQVVIPAHPLAAAAAAAAAAASDPYHSAPPTPSLIESYPPPLPPPPPLYYSGYSSAPPTPYYPYATSSRSLTLVETSCPCPLQGCQKNVDTGPLTGFISKGPVEQRETPLSPVALSLPKEPHDIRSLPSPARGSAGSRPTPSPAIATAKNPNAWNEPCCEYGCDTAGLLAISKTAAATAIDSAADLDSGIDGIGDLVDEVQAKRRSRRHEFKKMKLRRFRSAKGADKQCLGKVCPSLCDRVIGTEGAVVPMRLHYSDVGSVAATAAATATSARSARSRADSFTSVFEWCDSTDASYISAEAGVDQGLTIKYRKKCKRWHERTDDDGEPSDLDMPPKLYPEVDVEYQNRLRRGSGAVADGEPPAKKSTNSNSVGSFAQLLVGIVDVEKSNYLSALELRSVSDSGPEPVPAALSASALVQSLSPLNGYADKRVKVNAVERPAHSAADAVCVKHSRTTAPASAARAANVDCEPRCASTMTLAVAKCHSSSSETRKPRFRRRRWTTKKRIKKKKPAIGSKSNEEEKLEAENAERRRRDELLSLTQKRAACRLKWSNGWTWLGEPFVAKVFMNTESSEVLRTCYHAMKHQSGDIIRPKDCILLRSGSKKTDLPYVAKVAHLWEDPEDGEMMISLFWYYRPEHTEHDAKSSESPYELYASKHKDINSVACIEDKCYVLTFNEYCRYHKSIRQNEESVDISSVIVPPLGKKRYPRLALLPPENTSLDLVYFCRKIYDFRQHRLLKNPFFV